MARKWIDRAIQRKGAFRAKAKKAGKSTRAFASQVMSNPEKYDPRTRRQAALARTLISMHSPR
jgi:hypothetical protein